MKKFYKIFYITAILGLLFFVSCDETQNQNTPEVFSLKTKKDSINYSLGVNIATKIKSEGATEIDPEIILEAIEQVYKNEDSLLITNKEAIPILQNYFAGLHKDKVKQNKIDGKTFLQKNRDKKGIVILDNGLQYEVLQKGNGEIPTKNDMVSVNFKGQFTDGTVFDNTFENNSPVTFAVNKSIEAWQIMLTQMQVGEKRKLYVPPELAYGSKGSGEVIKPNTVLIYELELVEIKTPM